MLLKAKKYAAIGMVMAVLLSIVSACTPASVDITPVSTPDTQAMTTPEITAEPTEEPTAKPTPKPTMTPAPTPIGEPKRLVYAEGDEMPEYDDSVYDEYDIVTIYYPDGNSREENPRPFGVSMLLPKGWTWRDGIFDGLGYFPSEELAGYCIAEWRLYYSPHRTIYNEKGECVATVGYAEWDWSDETLAGYAEALDIELTRETLKTWSNQEKASFGLYHTFDWVILGQSMAALRLGDQYDHDVESGANSKTVVTSSGYCEKLNPNFDERLTLELPVAATFDLTYNVGIFVEFGDGQLTSEQIDFIAESIRFCGLEW